MGTHHVASRLSRLALAACVALPVFAAAARASASCAEPLACACTAWPTGHVLRGKVRDARGDAMTEVEVSEVFAGEGIETLSPGDVIRGVLDMSRTCGLSIGGFADGDEVLALWQGSMPEPDRCPEFSECTAARCRLDPAYESFDPVACRADCAESAREACPADSDEPRLMLVPWAPELDLGEGRTLDAGAAGILANRLQCSQRFPSVATAECNDVIRVPVSEGCSVAVPGPATRNRSATFAFALLGLALALWVRRTRRS